MHCTLCHNSPPPPSWQGQCYWEVSVTTTEGRGASSYSDKDSPAHSGEGGSSWWYGGSRRVQQSISCKGEPLHCLYLISHGSHMTEKGIGCGKSLGGQKGKWCQKESGGEQGLDWRRYGVLLWVLRFMNNYCYIRRPSPEQETTTGQWRDGQDSQCQIFSRLDQRGGSQQVCCVCVCFKVCTVGWVGQGTRIFWASGEERECGAKVTEHQGVESICGAMQGGVLLANILNYTVHTHCYPQCNYTAEYPGEMCKRESHVLSKFKVMKRCYECKGCHQRQFVYTGRCPVEGCQKCGGTSHEQVSLYRERKGPTLPTEQLKLRGDEEKYLNSLQ